MADDVRERRRAKDQITKAAEEYEAPVTFVTEEQWPAKHRDDEAYTENGTIYIREGFSLDSWPELLEHEIAHLMQQTKFQPLKELRAERRLTQGQLAQRVGVSPGNVGDWETGKSKPGYAALVALARTLEVSADELLELERPAVDVPAGLSGEEEELMELFCRLPAEQRQELLEFARFKCQRYGSGRAGAQEKHGG